MIDNNVEDFLEHFGVKGMRWGVRKQNDLDRISRVSKGTSIHKKRLNKQQKIERVRKVQRFVRTSTAIAVTAAIGLSYLNSSPSAQRNLELPVSKISGKQLQKSISEQEAIKNAEYQARIKGAKFIKEFLDKQKDL